MIKLVLAEWLEKEGADPAEFLAESIRDYRKGALWTPDHYLEAPASWIGGFFMWEATARGFAYWQTLDYRWKTACDGTTGDIVPGMPLDMVTLAEWPTDFLAVALRLEEWRRDNGNS